MKRIKVLIGIMILLISGNLFAKEPDKAYLFAYATDKNSNHNGLHFAWSIDKENWFPIGPEHSFVRCDYGRWGSEKRMLSPFLFQSSDGIWHCVWSMNERDGAFAHVSSSDLVYWGRQSYPIVAENKNCLSPEISFDKTTNLYTVTWLSSAGTSTEAYSVTTKDFKEYSAAKKIQNSTSNKQTATILGKSETGTIHNVPWKTIDNLIKTQQLAIYKNTLYSENSSTDSERFASLESVSATISINTSKSKKISDLLMGIFFEDINYAADGGLYAELVQNRDFEYALSDKEGHDKSWNSYKAWSLNNADATFIVDSVSPIHANNKHYASLQINRVGAGLVNEGYDGIVLRAGDKYDFSIFARTPESKKGKLTIRLIGKDGKVCGEASTKSISSDWKKYDIVLTATQTVVDAKLVVVPQMTGKVELDMISLFPQKTFKGRKNGLRDDLAKVIADMHPRFVRFPGGCVAHGDGLENMYRWKNTIGPLETRKPQRNLWGYHQTMGLGYFEYFQFCEDLGAEPVPVVPAGVPCQNSAHHGHAIGGQQGGIPMCDMDDYVQEVLDLIEWANGDVDTKWGKKRAEAGHPKPFNLKYIGIGNEDLITDVFEERFAMIYNTVKEKHPEITVIGTVGPFYEGTDYVEGWDLAAKLEIPMVDEHYYNSPGWYIHNQDFYDKYDRSKSKVYLGEYAAHLPGRPNNIETALAEALHLANVERNGDIVTMTSYAPLFAKERYTQWNPDLIYFNNGEVKPTVGYYVQMLYGQNAGDEYIASNIELSDSRDAVRKRIAKSIVRDSKTGDVIIKLVNMLPVEVDTKLNLDGISISNPIASRSLLTGKPDDKLAKPVYDTFNVNDNYKLPAYSFTILRIKTK
ncbi:alpha-L-arabinofuranosidase [Dysgonomonas sp. Marseille-P4677]|uniref:alpha-L-arabinofuranosidase C-terminal domain-containing protein n=1 Tax=Dysgonomonas sp. Marseille-P4677 TaxID=2364790 RepID=UPI00191344DA|nr:alpha-L-arabinofuranosidase C-terminal domain-containing protein [Dysgonomonas sp. Marseille-P4677]MBK5721908.1 alpha-L-arabinofuranosidase [Dysgonomonas sp. Marseille-P4677]